MRQGIQGRFLKDGSTEYTLGDEGKVTLRTGHAGVYLSGGILDRAHPEYTWPELHATRKAAIERIEQLLCGDAA